MPVVYDIVFMKSTKYVLLAIVATLVVLSCNKTEDALVDLKYDYFPTDSSRYVVYDVDSIIWNSFFDPPQVDTISFQVKELYTDEFVDGSGITMRRIERYRRVDERSPWVLLDVWSAGIDGGAGIWNEENLRFIKMVFPIKKGTKWQGNSFINVNQGPIFLGDWEYEALSVDVPATVNGFSFDSTVTVRLYADSNLIEKTTAREIYAKHVGLVYKEWQWLTKNRVDVDFPEGTEDGFIVRMLVNDYGTE